MLIRTAVLEDIPRITQYDRHISQEELDNLVRLGRVCICQDRGEFCGWLRWNLFWDNTPFLNLLYLLEPHRGKGFGREMMAHWEAAMKVQGYAAVMTSTASDEYAQHFYRKLGYTAIGGFTPLGEVYELIFQKEL